MRRRLAALLLVVASIGERDAAGGSSGFRAGLASVDLTPSGPVPLGGYADRFGKLSTGVHDPVKARALVITDGSTKVAIVSVDLVGVSREAKAAVVARLKDRGLTSKDVLLAATHTHSGPGGLTQTPLFRPMMGVYDAALFDEVTAKIADAIAKADDAMAPARVAIGLASAPGLQRNRAVENGPVDDRLDVLRIDGEDGKPRGFLVHFAAHPTILGAKNLLVSADWPGAMCDALEERFPSAVAMLLQSAEGDLAPSGGEGEGFDRVRSFGRLVAERAVEASAAARTLDPSHVEVDSQASDAPLPRTVASTLLGSPRGSALVPESARTVEFQVVTIDAPRASGGSERRGVALAAIPGEPTTACAESISRSLYFGDGPPSKWLVACANDHLGYFTDRDGFRAGGYEASLNVVGPHAAEWLEREIGSLPRPRGHRNLRAGRTGPDPLPSADGALPTIRGATPFALGFDHGDRLRERIRDLLRAAETSLLAEAERSGLLKELALPALASGLTPKDLVVPALVLAARGLQKNVPAAQLDEMEGVAEGAGVPYDSILLENVFLTMAEQPDPKALLRLPARCTNGAFTGPATTLGQAIHVSTLDWGMVDVLGPRTVAMVVEPPTGHPFVSVTWPGMVGTLRAMGAQGLSVTEESIAAPDDSRPDGIPINCLLRDVVQNASGLDDAVRRVVSAPGTCGYHVTIVDGNRRDARVIERSATRVQVRKPVDGVLWGCDPTEAACFDGACDARIPRADGSSTQRYAACRDVFRALQGRFDARRALDALPAAAGVVNDGTLLACVFEPQTGRFHTALGAGVDPDPLTGALTWSSHDLPALLSPAARAAERFPPRVDAAPTVVEGARARLAGVERIALSFDSPLPSGVARNDRVEAALFLPVGREPVGAVIHLPAWRERDLAAESLVALSLATQGFAVVLMPLPWQASRAAEGVAPGEWTLSPDLARTREAWRQGLGDVLAVSRWLESARGFAPARQAVFGISLGGHVAAVAYGAYPDRFAAGAFVLTGGNLGKLLASHAKELDGLRVALDGRGVRPEDVVQIVGVLDPATWASPARRDGVLLVGARKDEIVPAAHVEALAEAYGGARIVWVEGDHMALNHAGEILRAVVSHLRERLTPR